MKKDIALGVIGAGYFGRHYIRLVQDIPGAELAAVADRSFGDSSKKFPDVPASVKKYADAHALIADTGIDALIIATPASSHCSLAVRALAAGKHVLVEKPMALDSREAESIRAAVQKSDRTFMVGHQYLYNDHIRHLKKEISKGALGAIRYVFAEHLYFGPIRADIGCLAETAVHELAIFDYLFSPGEVVDARGRAVDFFTSGPDDFASVSIRFAGGLSAAITVSWFAPEKVRRMTVGGTKGMAVFDEQRPEKLKYFLHPYPADPAPAGAGSHFLRYASNEITVPAISAGEPLRNQLEHFISCVRTGTEPQTGISHGLRVTQMMDVILREISG